MLIVKQHNKPAEKIPFAHDTKRSEDGKTLIVVDKDGKDIEGKTYDASAVEVVERVRD